MLALKSYFAKTSEGPHLRVNEDGVDVDIVNKLFMIFDGFGGAGIGDATVQTLISILKKFFLNLGADPNATFPFYFSPKYLLEGNALINAMLYAQKTIYEVYQSVNIDQKGGASAIMSCLSDSILTIISTGNCASYLYRNGRLYGLTTPDTLDYVDGNKDTSCFQTTPLSGFGLFEEIHYNVKEIRLKSGDRVVFLTDGVYSRIDRTELKFHLDSFGKGDEIVAKKLFEAANERGNRDNQSVIFLKF